ncbi:hypothetical protein FGO68_gene7600 [Halteria grandinella]|uniref:Uncharacterized protein n=1 Tax=Halteria grandinella TaxID=5974 RepID=A0A8J8NKE4_HALGN|nr:hypothetical protein FGO68_gene7600 [Halteria grandinella]
MTSNQVKIIQASEEPGHFIYKCQRLKYIRKWQNWLRSTNMELRKTLQTKRLIKLCALQKINNKSSLSQLRTSFLIQKTTMGRSYVRIRIQQNNSETPLNENREHQIIISTSPQALQYQQSVTKKIKNCASKT